GVRHDLVGRHGATADDLHEMQWVIEGGGGNEVDGVAGVHRRLSVTEELLEERGPLLDALRLQARDDAGPEARGVPQQLGYAAARHRQGGRPDLAAGDDPEVYATDDGAEGVAEEVNPSRVDVRARGRIQIQRGQRAGERDEIGGRLAQVIARGQQAREVDEARAGGIDLSIRTGRAGRVVHDIQIERALDRAARRQPEPGVQRIGGG